MNSLLRKSISTTFSIVYAIGAVILVSPDIAHSAFTCAANTTIYTDQTSCESDCRMPLTCSVGEYNVSGNSTLYNNPFNKIVWGTEPNTEGTGFPTVAVKTLSWIDFQNIAVDATTGTSGGKLNFGFTEDKVKFSSATTPGTNEIFSNYRPLVGVSATAGSLEFLMVNPNTGLPEITGSIPTNGKVKVVGGTHKADGSLFYTNITRIATDTSKKTMMMYGILPTGNETTVAEVVIEPVGAPVCPIMYEPGNPANIYTCDADNKCYPPGRCDMISGLEPGKSIACSQDINKNGLMEKNEYAECGQAVRVDQATSSSSELPPNGKDVCPIGVVDCNKNCPVNYTYVQVRDRCEQDPVCPNGTYNKDTKNCELASTPVYTCPDGGTLSGTTCTKTDSLTLTGNIEVIKYKGRGAISTSITDYLTKPANDYLTFDFIVKDRQVVLKEECAFGGKGNCGNCATPHWSGGCWTMTDLVETRTGNTLTVTANVYSTAPPQVAGTTCADENSEVAPNGQCVYGISSASAMADISEFAVCPVDYVQSGLNCSYFFQYPATLIHTCPDKFYLYSDDVCAITPDCSNCPPGGIMSGSSCVANTAIPSTQSYSCPTGAQLNGTDCITTTTTTATMNYICPAGGSLSGSNCKITNESPADIVYSCPLGTNLSGTQCTVPSYNAPVTYSCNLGDDRTGTTCTHSVITTYPVGPGSCNSGDTLSGTTCTHLTTTPSTYTASVGSCNAGDSLSGTTCTHTVITTYAASYTCNAGGTLTGTSCRYADTLSTYSAPISCNAGDSLSGTTCTKITAPSTYATTPSCNAGDSLVTPILCKHTKGWIATFYAPTQNCNAGDTVSGTTCTHITPNTYYSAYIGACNTGDTLSGSTCTHGTPVILSATPGCSAGDSLAGTTCTNTTVTTYSAPWVCTAGDSLSGSTCSHVATVASFYPMIPGLCNAGDSLSGSTCSHVTLSTYSGTPIYSCPTGGNLTGTSCDFPVKTALTSYECTIGGYVLGDKCVNETIYMATKNYECSAGALNENQCILTTTTPADIVFACVIGTLVGNVCDATSIFVPGTPVVSTSDQPNNVCWTARALVCPLGNFACSDKVGDYSWQCSPALCMDFAKATGTTNDETSVGVQNDGAVDPTTGQCMEQVQVFAGNSRNCRNMGFYTGWQPCCSDSIVPVDTAVNDDGMSASASVGAVTGTVAGAAAISSMAAMTGTAATVLAASGPFIVAGAVVAAVLMISSMILKCDDNDFKTVTEKVKGKCHEVGTYCKKMWSMPGQPPQCVQRATSFCCFDSMLSRIVHEQGRPMISTFNPSSIEMTDPVKVGTHYRGTDKNNESQGWIIDPNKEPSPGNLNCRGMTIEEFSLVDMGNLDMTEWTNSMTARLEKKVNEAGATMISDIQMKVQNSLNGMK
jgi:conjugal transfer mating pair stabilization protein TraN